VTQASNLIEDTLGSGTGSDEDVVGQSAPVAIGGVLRQGCKAFGILRRDEIAGVEDVALDTQRM
jgi:hypothetical protein